MVRSNPLQEVDRMQQRHRGSTQTIRDALECAGSQFHHGPSLRSTQWTLLESLSQGACIRGP